MSKVVLCATGVTFALAGCHMNGFPAPHDASRAQGGTVQPVNATPCPPDHVHMPFMGCVSERLVERGIDAQRQSGTVSVRGTSYGTTGAAFTGGHADADDADTDETQDDGPKRFRVLPRTARDPDTGLVWQRRRSPNMFDLAGAQKHCSALKLDGRGWRVPTRDELRSIVRKGQSPAMDPRVFPETEMKTFVTSTKESLGYVSISTMMGIAMPTSGPNSVLCVRDAP